MTGKDLTRLVGALLLGAAIAFPAGLWVAGRQDAPGEALARRPQAASGRAIFSPSIQGDPAFLERQREGIEALEAECRRTGAFCAEARQARRWLEERAAH